MAINNLISPLKFNNLLSERTANLYASYSQQFLHRLLRFGILSGVKVGQVWLIDKESLDIYLNKALYSTEKRFKSKLKNEPAD